MEQGNYQKLWIWLTKYGWQFALIIMMIVLFVAKYLHDKDPGKIKWPFG